MKRGFLNRPDAFKKPSNPASSTSANTNASNSTPHIIQQTLPTGVKLTMFKPGSPGTAGLEALVSRAENMKEALKFKQREHLPNSTIPWYLSTHETSLEQTTPVALAKAWLEGREPQPITHICRQPRDGKPVCIWLAYPDLLERADLNAALAVDPVNPEPRPYAVVPVGDMGLGMRAVQDIPRGAPVVRERPLVMYPIVNSLTRSMDDTEAYLTEVLAHLDPADLLRFRALHNCKPREVCGPLAGVIRTNGLQCQFVQSKFSDYGGVCVEMSRANHSCSPNATYAFDTKTLIMEMRATRPIRAGEEITLPYLPTIEPRASRQEALQKSYYFTCRCSACTSSIAAVEASDELRAHVHQACFACAARWQWWYDTAFEPATDFISDLRTLLAKIDAERLDGYRGVPVRWLAHVYAALGDEGNFKKWARKAVKHAGLLSWEGGFVPVDDWTRWIEDATKIPFWNTRNR